MSRVIFVSVLITLVFAGTSFAGKGFGKVSISGYVRDTNGQPVSDVRVTVKYSGRSTYTDESGRYTVEYVPWIFKVIYSKRGCLDREVSFNFALYDIINRKDVYLEKAGSEILIPVEEVVMEEAASFVTSEDRTRGQNSVGMKFVYIQPGSFMMGSPFNDTVRDADEKEHMVTVSKGFYMQTTEVTQGEWREVMGDESDNFPERPFFKDCGEDCPMENVSWNDVQDFIRRLNQRENTNEYRLPTEAEWEYTCRAGSTSRFCYGNDVKSLDGYAWYKHNSDSRPHAVARKKPNAWGLYDMHGNVWEWCQDYKGEYPSSHVTDPTGPSHGSFRICRGGSWRNYYGGVRSAYRDYIASDRGDKFLGFRVVSVPEF